MHLFLYVMEQAGRKYVRDMPWPPSAECHTITTNKTVACSMMYSMHHISKKPFRPGGIIASNWTRSVRAERDTMVADHTMPAVNTMHGVAYHPPIALFPSLPQTLQEHSQMLLKAPAVMVGLSGCYKISILG